MKNPDVIILGAGAAGLMCAIEAGKRGRRVLVLDHANKVGKKILMSGGGRCNFTNYDIEPHHYLSNNPHFCKSALKRYSSTDFIALVRQHQIPYHEKSHGQLFCDNKSVDIVNLLLAECEQAKVMLRINTAISEIKHHDVKGYEVTLANKERLFCQSLVIATGGLSIPTMGATPFGYQIASQFGLSVIPTRAGLVPFTLQPDDKERFAELSGIALSCEVEAAKQSFKLNMLFTHRGLSGPAMLQISSYWQAGKPLTIDLDADEQWSAQLLDYKKTSPRLHLKNCLEKFLPKKVIQAFVATELLDTEMHRLSDKKLQDIIHLFRHWQIKPNGTEGYRTAEVTLGGVDTHHLSSQTMEVKTQPGLFFVGEVMDVSGWLGGYNFQWAWSSGWAAGQVV